MFKKVFQLILQFNYKNRFKRNCYSIGNSPTILGDVKFTGNGKLISGDKLFIRCEKTNPVKIHIKSTAELKMGNQVFLNNGVQLSCSEKIMIGNHVDIADDCLIIDNDFHSVGSVEAKTGPIIIEDDVWIASRVIILKDVTIGKGAVIGAGSIVTKSIPPYTFVAGNPAKIIRKLK